MEERENFFYGITTFSDIHPWKILVIIFLIAYPGFTSDFFTFQIGSYSLILGTIA